MKAKRVGWAACTPLLVLCAIMHYISELASRWALQLLALTLPWHSDVHCKLPSSELMTPNCEKH